MALAEQTSVLNLAYEAHGPPDGPPVLLLHGFPDDARGWEAVADGLARAGRRVVAPYLRGFGPTCFLGATTPRSGQLAALAADALELADALGLGRFTLVGHDWGARAAQAVAALYPDRVERLVSFTDYEIAWNDEAFPPYPALHALWYQWVLLSDLGPALLKADRRGFCRYLWGAWSPTWNFSDAAFEDAARSFDNPDFARIVLSAYRHGRREDATEDPRYAELEARLAAGPEITVPTALLIGADDGVLRPHPEDERWRSHFTGPATRHLLGGVGHFPHRERPQAVIAAVLAPVLA